MTSKSLSDLWRENRSKDPGADLASILDGARIMAQSLNPDTDVSFAGVKTANTVRKQINLPSSILGGEYPVPGDIVDVLLGLTVHETGHTLFSDNRAIYTDKLVNKANAWLHTDRKIFNNLVNIFEDIYIDHIMTAYPGYRDYLQRERDWALGEFSPNSVTKPLETKCTRTDMLNAMIYLTLAGGKMPQGISDENIEILGKIASNANKMCTKKLSKSTAILNSWKILKGLPISLSDEERGFGKPVAQPDGEVIPAPDKAQNDAAKEKEEQEKLEKQEGLGEETEEVDDETEPEEKEEELGGEAAEEERGEGEQGEKEEDGEGKEDGGEEKEPEEGIGAGIEEDTTEKAEDMDDETPPDTTLDLASQIDSLVDDNSKLPPSLAKDVSDAVVEKRADLTQLLSYLAKDSRYTIIAYTPGENAQKAAEARNKTAQVEEMLRRILQDYRLRRTRDYRGLLSGRVSSRRLHRAAYGDQRVFQRREKPEEIDMAVCLLMDLSGSVYKYESLIEQITCAICDAFQKEKMEFIALGYSERGGNVYIPRLYDKEVGRVNLSLKKEWSMTPSYEGLAAATAQLLRLTGKKQKILFHFTDGEPNSGNSAIIPDLLDDARVKGITDIHVCLGGHERGMFINLYGSDTMFINDINQLPDIVDQELRKRLQV